MNPNTRRTKIVATIGPASWDEKTLEELLDAGLDVARLNFSHGDKMTFTPLIARLRSASRKAGRALAILQDLQGPKIRIGSLAGDGPVELRSGDRFVITTEEVEGDASRVSTTYPALPLDVKPGDPVLLDDGLIELRVIDIPVHEVVCEVVSGGELHARKGINLPRSRVRAPALTRKDKQDLTFGIAHEVDYVALSFVRHAEDVEEARQIIREMGRDTPIIAKIERYEAIENLDEILAAADGVMVARGDLGVETSSAELPILQKDIIRRSGERGKLDITATQMLQSMIENPRPTRAEACDVANAVFDGTDAIMLSAETAVGAYPVESVRTMAAIAAKAETEVATYGRRPVELKGEVTVPHATAHAACLAAKEIGAKLIVCLTRSGTTAVLVSQRRPSVPIIALTPQSWTYCRLALAWGVTPIRVPELKHAEQLAGIANKVLRESNLIRTDECFVLVTGDTVAAGATNTLRILRAQ